MKLLILFLTIFLMETDDEAIIKNKLQNQAICWNEGDLECFMNDYLKSDKLIFIGKSGVTYGWNNTLNNYKKNYPSKKEMGQLRLEIIELNKIDGTHYFMVGKWHLTRDVGDLSGHFSLLWKKIENEWVIISDHSS